MTEIRPTTKVDDKRLWDDPKFKNALIAGLVGAILVLIVNLITMSILGICP